MGRGRISARGVGRYETIVMTTDSHEEAARECQRRIIDAEREYPNQWQGLLAGGPVLEPKADEEDTQWVHVVLAGSPDTSLGRLLSAVYHGAGSGDLRGLANAAIDEAMTAGGAQ